jgi:hypothetical protein
MSYLILHKVRGEPAFDIADKLDCPVCESARQGLDHGRDYAGNCNSCDDGYWWIIPTSGHRAYPYQTWPMQMMWHHTTNGDYVPTLVEPPAGWPDHYPMDVGAPPKPDINIMSLISGLLPKMKDRRF